MKKLFLLFFICLFTIPGFAQIKLPKLVSDGMVLQRNEEVKIWGWAAPEESVTLHFKDETYTTTATAEGDWEFTLPDQPAGGPFQMVFESSNKITLNNILFGDVWLASGQSNMELTMERLKYTYPEIIKNSENPYIREFQVPDAYNFKKKYEDFEGGSWKIANPNNVLNFSGIAYLFARELFDHYDVPVGIINAALGGSPVESWMSEETLEQFPDAFEELQRFKNDSLIAAIQQSDRQRSDDWYGELNEKDRGFNAEPNWSEPGANDSNWEIMEIPGFWADETPLGLTNGVVWFHKEIDVPAQMTGKKAALWMGRLVDQDYVYVNGEMVGTTGYQYPPRRYVVDEGILKEGKNMIAVRLINSAGKGGFIPDKPYYLAVGKDTIDLKGDWKYRLGAEMSPLESQTFIRWKPGGLYNREIAPLTNYRIKGVIWYQGEANTGEADKYEERFEAMIKNWRDARNQGDFPFLFVQLANFMESYNEPAESNWAELRQAQLNTLDVPNTGMAVAIDLGEWNDIHPLNKMDVAKRLSLLARKLAYGEEDIVASGPVPENATSEGNKVTITFKNTGSGLMVKGESLKEFAIAGEDGNFKWANAKIRGNTVVVWNEDIKKPEKVRYAWADNPDEANLYNEEELPATPFEIEFIVQEEVIEQ